MRAQSGLVSLLFICLFAAGGSAQSSKPQDADKPWAAVRSLGKLWQWHTLLGISPDGTKLLLGGYSSILAVYDLGAGKVVQTLRTRESVQDAAFSPDGKLLAVAEWRDGVTLRHATTMDVVANLNGSAKLGAWQVRFSRDGRRLVGYSWWGPAKQFWSYDLRDKEEIGWPAGKNEDTEKCMMREGLRGWGHHLFSVEKERAKGYYTGYRVWVTDAATGKPGAKTNLGDKDYFQFDLDAEGVRAVIMQPGEDPRLVDLTTGKTIRTLPGHERWVTCAAFSPNDQLLVTASGTTEDGFARVYSNKSTRPAARTEIILRDVATGAVVAAHHDPQKNHDYARIGFSPNGKYVWALTREKELVLWGQFPTIPAQADPFPNFDGEVQLAKAAKAAKPAVQPADVDDRFTKLIQGLAASKRTSEQKVEALFLAVLGRPPTSIEKALALANGIDAAALSKLLQVLVASQGFRAHVADMQKRLPK